MKRILLTTALAAVPFALATSAQADCFDITDIGSDDVVTCDATSVIDGPDAVETREIKDGSKRVTVNVEAGAVLDTTASGKDAIKLKDDDTTVNNSGTIHGGDEAIVGGDDLEVNNEGTIIGEDHAIVGENEDDDPAKDVTVNNGSAPGSSALIEAKGGDAIKAGDGLTLNNYGTITADDDLIQAEEGDDDGADDVTVNNYGTLAAKDKGVTVDNGTGLTLLNDTGASITSNENEAVEAGDDADITNRGTIQGFDDAVQVGENATIENFGLIENTQTFADLASDPDLEAQDSIDIDSGTITNHAGATIKSTTNAAIDFDPGAADSYIHNAGTITGTYAVTVDEADMAGQHIYNAGVLEGTEGIALNLGMGEDSLTMEMGGTLIGGVDMGAQNDMFAFALDYVFSPGDFAGGGLLDGSTGFDVLSILGLSSEDIAGVSVDGSIFSLSLFGETDMLITSWERIAFSDGLYHLGDDGTLSAVPLPAGGVLILSALAGMGIVARRRKTA